MTIAQRPMDIRSSGSALRRATEAMRNNRMHAPAVKDGLNGRGPDGVLPGESSRARISAFQENVLPAQIATMASPRAVAIAGGEWTGETRPR